MCGLQTKIFMKCLVYKQKFLWNVWFANQNFYEMSGLQTKIFMKCLVCKPKISELSAVEKRSGTVESKLHIFTMWNANKFFFVLCAVSRSVTPLYQKVIFWALYISLFECRDETEFIPLCGARGTWDGGPIHCRQGRQQKCRAMTSATAQRTRPHSATTTHVHPCWTIFISALNLLRDDAKNMVFLLSLNSFSI